MSEDTAAAPAPAPAVEKKQKQKKKKPTKPAEHPKYSEMLQAAITSLKERSGSSRQAILKYIMANYKVNKDMSVVNSHLKMALRAGVANGKLQQKKGTGASGSFRMAGPAEKKPSTKPSKKAAPKKVSPKKKPAAKKAKSPKKTKAAKPKAKAKKAAAKKPKAKAAKPKKAKSPKKAAKPKAKKPAKKTAKK